MTTMDTKRQPPMRLLLRVSEAAEALGLSRSTVYELIAAGEITPIRIGAAVRIPVTELEQWVAARRETRVE
jgi:excisionase family DNA binding protein